MKLQVKVAFKSHYFLSKKQKGSCMNFSSASSFSNFPSNPKSELRKMQVEKVSFTTVLTSLSGSRSKIDISIKPFGALQYLSRNFAEFCKSHHCLEIFSNQWSLDCWCSENTSQAERNYLFLKHFPSSRERGNYEKSSFAQYVLL